MRRLWRDILAAWMMGMILPGIMLNYAVMALRQQDTARSIQIAVPEETEETEAFLPVLFRNTDGSTERGNMEEYLVCVVLAEMPAVFDTESLKAQSVAARTYARKAWITGGKHGDGSVCGEPGCCQAYLEPERYCEKGGTEAAVEKVREAVYATAGECLEYEGELIEATYFSCSGGRTEDALEVWGSDYPYLQSVDSPGEETAERFADTVTFSLEQFAAALDLDTPEEPESWITEAEYTQGGGVKGMTIGGKRFEGTRLRSLLGLRSTAFEWEISEDRIVITTRGYGHRVGMSQYGAEAMALEGCTYREILPHYYPGTELVTVQDQEAENGIP